MESWEKEGKKAICSKRNEQRKSNFQKKCQFCNEWEEISHIIKASVSIPHRIRDFQEIYYKQFVTCLKGLSWR